MAADDYASWNPEVPEEQTKQAELELQKMKSSIGIIDDVLKWLDASIHFYGNTDSLGIDETTPDEQVKLALIIAKKMKHQFENQAIEFVKTYGEYINKEDTIEL